MMISTSVTIKEKQTPDMINTTIILAAATARQVMVDNKAKSKQKTKEMKKKIQTSSFEK